MSGKEARSSPSQTPPSAPFNSTIHESETNVANIDTSVPAKPATLPRLSTRQGFRRALIAGIVLLALALGAGLSSLSAAIPPTGTTIAIDNFTFGPNVLTVKAGTTVTWVNRDDIPHTIVDKNRKVFRSKVLDTEETFSFTFAQPGTYDYFCGLHPHMTGQVVVTP
jgi:amicyanin